MLNLLLLLIINAFVIHGFHYAAEPGMIFGKIRNIKLPMFVRKPLYYCITCMASIHSTYVYWSFMEWNLQNLIKYPIYILALSGVTTFVWMVMPEATEEQQQETQKQQ